MKRQINLQQVLGAAGAESARQLELFAILTLGIMESALNAEEAPKEFQREIAAIRRLCLGLLEEHRLVA
ncbi:MAG: hypothetical protein RLZZ21_1845 [Planctomycetota bacterium]